MSSDIIGRGLHPLTLCHIGFCRVLGLLRSLPTIRALRGCRADGAPPRGQSSRTSAPLSHASRTGPARADEQRPHRGREAHIPCSPSVSANERPGRNGLNGSVGTHRSSTSTPGLLDRVFGARATTTPSSERESHTRVRVFASITLQRNPSLVASTSQVSERTLQVESTRAG